MIFVQLHRLAPLATLFALVACGGLPLTPPTQIVDLAQNDFGRFVLLVYDASGLVTGGRPAQSRPGASGAVTAVPERQELEVAWTGGACSHQPTLEVSGDSSALRLVVRNPQDPQLLPFLPMACPAVGILLRVTLSLTEPVEQDAIGIEVSY